MPKEQKERLQKVMAHAGVASRRKSEELIRLLKRAMIAMQRVQVFKPRLDNRYSEGDVVSHSSPLARQGLFPAMGPRKSDQVK